MMPRRLTMRRSAPARGFSLVELMVGIVVAMAAVIVVMQVFKASEGQRRAASGGDDAQTTGTIAMSLMQRDLRQAGLGFTKPALLGCQLNLTGGRSIANLAPVTINPAGIPAGDSNTDVVMIGYGSGQGSPDGSLINSQPGAATYSVTAPQAFPAKEYVVATPQNRATPCALALTTVSGTPTGNNVAVALGMANAANGALFTFGQSPRFVVYAVRSGRLTACDALVQDCTSSDASNWPEVGDGIVSLRAEYARDTSVTRDAVPDVFDQTTPTTWCGWSRVVAVRVVLVARSRQPEKEVVPASAPSWTGSASIVIDGTDWDHYRYKTYEATVPLRNVPPAGDTNFVSC